MKRIQPISQRPAMAADIAPEVKLTFLRDVIEVSIPLFVNKEPTGSIDTSES